MKELIGTLEFDADCILNALVNHPKGTPIQVSDGFLEDLMRSLRGAVETLRGYQWIPVSERHPEAGIQVVVRRVNGTWDRGEIAPMWFDGLGGWYLPEGPTMFEDAPFWFPLPPAPDELG